MSFESCNGYRIACTDFCLFQIWLLISWLEFLDIAVLTIALALAMFVFFHNCRDELLRWPPYCSDSFSHPWLITLSLSLHSALLHYCNIAVVLASRTFPLSITYIMLINIFIIVSISYLNIDHIIAEPSLHYCNSVVVLASRTFPLFHSLHLITFLLWLKKWFTFIWICYCSLQIIWYTFFPDWEESGLCLSLNFIFYYDKEDIVDDETKLNLQSVNLQ